MLSTLALLKPRLCTARAMPAGLAVLPDNMPMTTVTSRSRVASGTSALRYWLKAAWICGYNGCSDMGIVPFLLELNGIPCLASFVKLLRCLSSLSAPQPIRRGELDTVLKSLSDSERDLG